MRVRPSIFSAAPAVAAVIVAAAALISAVSATAQSATPAPPNFGSAHGACGPGQPIVQRLLEAPVGVPAPGSDPNVDDAIPGRTRRSDLVMVGRVASVSVAAGQYGIWTTAVFDYPLILKTPPGGPPRGAARVSLRFLGGTALFHGSCTRQYGNDVKLGRLYLIFAERWRSGSRRGEFNSEASPVEEPSGLLTEPSGPHIYLPPGKPDTLAQVVAEIKAEVAREKAAAGGANK